MAYTGLRTSRPGWGLRQQRRVHAVFGGKSRFVIVLIRPSIWKMCVRGAPLLAPLHPLITPSKIPRLAMVQAFRPIQQIQIVEVIIVAIHTMLPGKG
jgi:hypothetical protein